MWFLGVGKNMQLSRLLLSINVCKLVYLCGYIVCNVSHSTKDWPLYSKSNYICAVLSDPNFLSLFSFLWIVLKVWSRGMMCFTFSLSASCVPNSPMWYSTFPIDPGDPGHHVNTYSHGEGGHLRTCQSQIRRLWCWIIRLKWKWGSYFHTCWYAPNCECIQLWKTISPRSFLTWLWDNGKQS